MVQAALKLVIEPIFEHEFEPRSFGFRQGLGCKDALREVRHLKAGYLWVVDADLQSYFDTIPHAALLAKVGNRIADGRVLELVKQFLTQDIMDDMKRWTPTAGSPQGAVINPLLANIYLHELDVEMREAGLVMVRYADDAVVLCRSREEVQLALARMQVWVTANGLMLHPDKTHLGDCLSSLDSNDGFRLDGAAAVDGSGASVSSAGDVNGDGFADLMVGAFQADPNGEASGSSYVVFGGDFTGAVTALGTSGEDKLKGSKAVDRFVAGDGNDTLIGRGGADVFHGGAGDDTIEIRDVTFQLVDGGAGNDTLKLDRSHLDLNLVSVHGKISDIEAIDMTGHGRNTLTLTVLLVLNLSSTSNTLQVDGNCNDSVVGLSSGWTDGGVADGYHTFTNGAAVLLVGVHVATDFA